MIRRALASAMTVLALPQLAAAQEWRVDVQGGRIRSALDPSARAVESVVAGIGFEDPASAFRLSAGIPTRSEAHYWGALAGWKRLAARRSGIVAGIDLSGNGFVLQSRAKPASTGGGLLDPISQPEEKRSGHAFAGQALPLIGFETGQFQLQARAGVSYYSATIAGQTRDRTVRLGDLQLTFQPSPTFALVPHVRRYEAADESSATFAGISGVVSQGRMTFWGSAGQWIDGIPDTASSARTTWSTGSSLRLTDRATINASARHDVFDPLYLNPPQTSWSAGLSILIGGRIARPAAPVPASYENGLATIRLPVSSAETAPSVAGDFNGWSPARMERDGKFWSYTVAAAPGVYNYAFVSPIGEWFVPENVPGRKDDGMGGHVAVLVVR